MRQNGGRDMNTVRIVADSGCDLSPPVAARYGITLVPVYVNFGGEMVPSDELTSDQFWARAGQSAQTPGTAAPAPGAFLEVFQKLVAAGHDVVCFTLPKKYSGTFNSAWVAAQEFGERVRVVDSGSISLGMGLQVLHAAREALAGRSAEVIQRAALNRAERTSVLFVLDTLDWVRRGGRLDRVMPLIEKVTQTLRVKPVLELMNGEFRLLGVVRSSRSSLQRIEEEMHSRLPVVAAAVAYTRGGQAAIDLVNRLAASLNLVADDIMLTEAGPVFAVHAGPNAIGAMVIRS
jgi:DegV family protein with EDD domain